MDTSMKRVSVGQAGIVLKLAAVVSLGIVLTQGLTAGQWEKFAPVGVPRRATGEIDLQGQAPRTADGRPDLSGVWEADPDPDGTPGGVENGIAPRHFISVASRNPAEVPLQPAARQLFMQRLAASGKDDPISWCEPAGVPRYDALPSPYKIVQTPALIVVLHEYDTTFRQIFLDGRRPPTDAQPTWMGYATARWERETLIVETTGFNDRSWLDVMGHPHSDAMQVTERFRRADYGHMTIEVTISDPKSYEAPIQFAQQQHLLADGELMESFCIENERDRAHIGSK